MSASRPCGSCGHEDFNHRTRLGRPPGACIVALSDSDDCPCAALVPDWEQWCATQARALRQIGEALNAQRGHMPHETFAALDAALRA